MPQPWRYLLPLLALGAAQAQDAPLPLFSHGAQEKSAADAAALVGQGSQGGLGPIVLAAAKQQPAAAEPEAPTAADKAEPLLAFMLEGVVDGTPLPQRWDQGQEERAAYDRVVYAASRLSAEALRRGARTDLTYAHLFNEPKKYRGEVVHVEGTLRQLRRYDPSVELARAGIKDLYEGWVISPNYGTNPWCVLFTELPAGVQVGDRLNYSVSFDGYFFKKFRYKARDSVKADEARLAPLLIGRTVVPAPAVAEAPPPDDDWLHQVPPAFLATIAAGLVLVLGLGWWFRRGDRHVQRRVETAAASRPFVLPEAPEQSTRD